MKARWSPRWSLIATRLPWQKSLLEWPKPRVSKSAVFKRNSGRVQTQQQRHCYRRSSRPWHHTTWPATASGWLSVIRAKDAMAASTEDGPVARRSRLPVALVRWIEGTLRQAETDKDTAMAERTKLEQVRNNMTASAGG
eukprot:TRINITY_DN12654_c2_g2_i6.p1 TRINITY_DN12654_c2_g2~~TRINITY_DN12654_c2_g2_i6.p1  ORF type:complete len:139 (+),score=15.10 TRINITY_DN12654_c2_g2_i6:112-528(+)